MTAAPKVILHATPDREIAVTGLTDADSLGREPKRARNAGVQLAAWYFI